MPRNLRQKDKDYLYGKRFFGKEGTEKTIIGTVKSFSSRPTYLKGGVKSRIKTILLVDIKDSDGTKLADHLWIDYDFTAPEVHKGNIIKLTGCVKVYSKLDYVFGGYRNNLELKSLRNIEILE